MSVLDDPAVRQALRQAWEESQPAMTAAHEEGGFVLEAVDGSRSIERWPRGLQDQIVVPPHAGGRRAARRIVATFHTHPNPGPEFQQEPSLTDVRAVRNDPDLRFPDYEGEYVIATNLVYRIRPDGVVEEVGARGLILGLS